MIGELGRFGPKRGPAGQGFVKDRAQGVDVGAGPDLRAVPPTACSGAM